jgi:ribonuclease G
LKHACQKRVWLKSGGYLIIEPTEAMVVIDVNTGKYSGKKNLEDTIRLINTEAAHEICHQLRLRNLSGIIMIDFIDMKEENDRLELMELLRKEVLRDNVKTTVIDMTPLGLVEMTRKKERRPLMEQLALFDK